MAPLSRSPPARNSAASYSVPALDSTGRFVVFTSLAGNFVLGDWNNGGDVFLRDRGPTPACAYQVSPPVIDLGAGGGAAAVSITTASMVRQRAAWAPPGATNAGVFQVSNTSIAGAAPPGRYYLRIRARNGCGVGPASSEILINVP